MDGETLYRGLVLWNGPAAELIPEISEIKNLFPELVPAQRLAELDQAYEHLIQEIAAADPTFFDDFAEQIRTGDPLKVQLALHDANVRTFRALLELPKVKEELSALEKNPRLKKSLAAGASRMAPADITTADIDRMIASLSLGEHPPIDTCLALNLAVIVNLALYFNVGVVQNIGIYLLVVKDIALPKIPPTVPVSETANSVAPPLDAEALAFSKRLNKGRMSYERMLYNIARTFHAR